MRVDDLLTTKQLMGLLHVDRTTIYRMLNDGRLPAVRVGGQWRFSRQTINAWLKDRHSSASAESQSDIPGTPAAAPLDSNILPISCLQPIQEVFAQTSDVGAVTTALDGVPIMPISNPSAFCSVILSTAQGRARCQASWQKLAHRPEERPRLEKCHAGFTYARGRVVVNGKFIAMFFIGQFVVGDAESIRSPQHIAQVANECGVSENELAQVAGQVRILEKDRAKRLLGLLQLVADTYSHIGQERLDLLTRLRRVAEIAGVPATQ